MLSISIRYSAPIMLIRASNNIIIVLRPIPAAANTGGNKIGPLPISTFIKVLKLEKGVIPFEDDILDYYC